MHTPNNLKSHKFEKPKKYGFFQLDQPKSHDSKPNPEPSLKSSRITDLSRNTLDQRETFNDTTRETADLLRKTSRNKGKPNDELTELTGAEISVDFTQQDIDLNLEIK
jgi:hypothetical protein